MHEIGPVQLLAVGFGPDAVFDGTILSELERLEEAGTVRVLDLLFVERDAETGDLVALDVEAESLGAIAGALLGFDFDEPGAPAPTSDGVDPAAGLTRADVESLGASLAPGMAAAVVLLEHVWARDLKRAVRGAGGVPLAEGFLTPELVAEVLLELVAVAEAIEEEQAAAGTTG